MADTTLLPDRSDNSGALPPSLQPGSEPPVYTSEENKIALDQLRMIEYGITAMDAAVEGHKYGMPDLPLPSDKRAKHRYDSVITQVTRLLMRDGKLAKAQRVRTQSERNRGCSDA